MLDYIQSFNLNWNEKFVFFVDIIFRMLIRHPHACFSCSFLLSLPLSGPLPFFSAAASSPFLCSPVFFGVALFLDLTGNHGFHQCGSTKKTGEQRNGEEAAAEKNGSGPESGKESEKEQEKRAWSLVLSC